MTDPSFAKSYLRKAQPFISIIVYLIYFFIILEISARIIFSVPAFLNKVSSGTYISDVVWRHQWIKRLRRDKTDLVVRFHYEQYDPLRGWSLVPNIKNMIRFENKTFNTNSHGVRDIREIPYEKSPGVKRIVILGESFTFGTEVSDDETYAYQLQQYLPANYEVINLGVGGYGYDQMLITLQEEGLKYNPDIVIVAYLAIDKDRSMLTFRDYAKPMFVLRNDKLILTHSPVLSPEQTLRREIFRSKIYDLLKLGVDLFKYRVGIYKKEEEVLNLALLNEITETARRAGAIPVVANIDGIRVPIRQKEMSEEDLAFTKYWFDRKIYCIHLLSYVNAADKLTIDEYGKSGKPLIFKRKQQHFSPREHSIIGYGIFDFLKRYNLI